MRLHDVGGSFGLKSHPSREDVAICLASMLIARPVKWVEDRVENLVSAGHARDERIEVEAAVDADGVLIGLRAKLSMDAGAYPLLNIPLNLFANIIKILLPGTLRLRNYAYDRTGRGHQQGQLCGLPRTVGDRVLGSGAAPGSHRARAGHRSSGRPPAQPAGRRGLPVPDADRRHARVHDDQSDTRSGVEVADYDDFRTATSQAAQRGRYTGIGICTYLEPGPGPTDYSQALGFTYEQRSFQRARVKVEIDGTVSVYTSQQPHGQSHETTLAQVAADELGVAFAECPDHPR